MSPLQIKILLHYHYSPYDYRNGDFSAPAVREAIDAFRDVSGLLRWRSGEEKLMEPGATYALTERGQAYVEQICRVPLPVQVWTYPKEAE